MKQYVAVPSSARLNCSNAISVLQTEQVIIWFKEGASVMKPGKGSPLVMKTQGRKAHTVIKDVLCKYHKASHTEYYFCLRA